MAALRTRGGPGTVLAVAQVCEFGSWKVRRFEMFEKGKKVDVPTRGISDHGFISSIYFRDPNGYVVELTAKNDDHDDHLQPNNQTARNLLSDWTERFHAEDSHS